MSKKASKDTLAALHGAVARVFAEYLDNPGEEGISAAMMAQIINFLKNNGINADLEKSPEGRRLLDSLPFTTTDATGNPVN